MLSNRDRSLDSHMSPVGNNGHKPVILRTRSTFHLSPVRGTKNWISRCLADVDGCVCFVSVWHVRRYSPLWRNPAEIPAWLSRCLVPEGQICETGARQAVISYGMMEKPWS